MNILIISDYDKIAYDLNANFYLEGYKSTLLTTKFFAGEESVVNISIFNNKKILWFIDGIRSFLFRHIFLRITGYSYYQDISEAKDYYSIDRIKKKIKDVPDVIIVLFDYRIVTTKTISDLYKWSHAKIIWMMVDMKPMTGGCSYSGNCQKYHEDCGQCPAIGNHILKGFAKKTLNEKINNLQGVNLHILAGSTFQAEQASSSKLFKDTPISTIFFPSDKNTFKYRNKSEAKSMLSLPSRKKIVLWGAVKITEIRKGYKYLLDALIRLKELTQTDDFILLTVGDGEVPDIERLPYQMISLGLVDFNRLALAYQAADVFVCPSIEDSGPIMVNQSIMCGTPVVAFKMGVSLDLIVDGQNGYLANLKDSKGLCNGIKNILSLSDSESLQMSENCLQTSKKLGHDTFYRDIDRLIKQN